MLTTSILCTGHKCSDRPLIPHAATKAIRTCWAVNLSTERRCGFLSGRKRHAVPNLCANWLRLQWSLIVELGCIVACSINGFENIAQTHEIVLLSQSVMSISTPSGSAKACLPMGHACKSLWMRTPACRRYVFSALIVEMRWRYCQVLPATTFSTWKPM